MRLVIGVLVLLAVAASSASAATEDVAPAAAGVPKGRGSLPIIYDIPIPMNAYCVGVGFDGTYFWVSAGDQQTGHCEFYILDEFGALVDNVQQGAGAVGWGHRDMAHDGTYMYGSYNQDINAFEDPSTHTGSFEGPLNPNRAMAYDGRDYYTGGFGENLWKVRWYGDWGGQAISRDLGGPWDGTYGLAYDQVSECLYMTTADYTGDLYKLSMEGDILDVYTTLPEYDMMGGCTMAQTRFGYVLAVLMQSDPDALVFYDLGNTEAPEQEVTEGSGTLFLGEGVPNPFRDKTEITYAARARGRVVLDVYDVAGRRVRRLLDRIVEPGRFHTLVWDGTDERGTRVASGVYFVKMEAAGAEQTKKLVLER